MVGAEGGEREEDTVEEGDVARRRAFEMAAEMRVGKVDDAAEEEGGGAGGAEVGARWGGWRDMLGRAFLGREGAAPRLFAGC